MDFETFHFKYFLQLSNLIALHQREIEALQTVQKNLEEVYICHPELYDCREEDQP